MDYQCLFKAEQDAYLQAWRGTAGVKFTPEPCPYIIFTHRSDASKIEVSRGLVSDSDVLDWTKDTHDAAVCGKLRILLSPCRKRLLGPGGAIITTNVEAPIPFRQDTFSLIAERLAFHKGFFIKERLGQASRMKLPEDKTSIFIESFTYREVWFKVFVTYAPKTQTTSVMIHNLLATELEQIESRLNEETLRELTIHPLFVLVLIIELQFYGILAHIRPLFGEIIRLQHNYQLHTDERFKDTVGENLHISKAAELSLGDEQKVVAVLERTEFTIQMGKKIIAWSKELNCATKAESVRFDAAGQIINNRLEYLVDTLDMQLIRLKRAQSHAQINRAGLETRNQTASNDISAHISEQSRDIAREAKRDSRAMKAIAVLTMFFLPGTFIAAFLTMPFFQWDTSVSKSIITNRFWIYWVITIPATVLVIGIWRMWYKFQEWRDLNGVGRSFGSEFLLWLRHGSSRDAKNKTDTEKAG